MMTTTFPTLASLFDGIGGFPLAAIRNGITPLWASEIETFPMEVTKIRFPDMAHVGDITTLKGAELPPVDIITGGSPCQDLSVAGRRAGLEGERSGLFMEQIRVTKELRDADLRRKRPAHLIRPRWFAWENVPGTFSSPGDGNKGEDFRVVLEEICRIVDSTISIPGPPSGGWESSGAILGEEFSLAWRVFDTQYWPGTPQRRRRIYLVADFGGQTAPQILFEQDRLLGDSAAGEGTRQGAAVATGGGAEDTGRPCLTACDAQDKHIAFACNQRDEVRDLNDVAAAVCASQQVKQQTLLAVPINTQVATRHIKLGEGTGFGVGEDGDPAYTLQAAHSHAVFTGQSDCLTPWDTQQQRIFTGESVAPTLAGADGGGGRNPGGLLFTAGFSAGASPTASTIGYQEECSPTLKGASSGTNMVPSVLCINDQGGQRIDLSQDVSGALRAQEKGHQPLVLYEGHGKDARYSGPLDVCPTVAAAYGNGGGNTPMVLRETDDPDSFCIAGNIIDRQSHNGGNHFGVQTDISYTLSTSDRHAVFSRQRVDVFTENDVVATQSARQYKDATDLVCEVAPKDAPNLIRRLTPLECERLQGYPDFWTLIPGCSDTARYKALGNSVAIPCVEYVLRGIAYFHQLLFAAESRELGVIHCSSTPKT